MSTETNQDSRPLQAVAQLESILANTIRELKW